MHKDERYDIVKEMIETGRIQEFRQFTKYLPKTVLARNLGTNSDRMTRLLSDPTQLKLQEIYEISYLFDVSIFVLLNLIHKQVHPAGKLQMK